MPDEVVNKEGVNKKDVVTIKKYANRRLYDTSTSSYVTPNSQAQMVKDGIDFVVYDVKSGFDITRSVLIQIIVKEESKGRHLLSICFLRHLISCYGDSLQAVVPNYLEHSMNAFAQNQASMRLEVKGALVESTPFSQFEEMDKQNMAMFENAMKIFVPFYGANDAQATNNSPSPTTTADAEEKEAVDELEALKAQLAQMQVQLDRMSGDK